MRERGEGLDEKTNARGKRVVNLLNETRITTKGDAWVWCCAALRARHAQSEQRQSARGARQLRICAHQSAHAAAPFLL